MKPIDIGNYLKELRLSHNLTQKELASKLHITHQAVSNWEQGKSIPDISILSQLGEFYGVSIDNIVLNQEPGKPKEEPKKPMGLRRTLAFFGLLFSLLFFSIFLNYERHYVSYIMFVVLLLMVSLPYSYLLKQRKRIVEYAIITGLLIITFIILFSSNPRYYMMDETVYLQLTEEIEILYPREFDEMTEAVRYHYIFDEYVLIYTEAESDIDIFNLSKFYEGEYTTIDTGTMKIYDLVVFDEKIYFSTYDAEIPGEFKLYNLDFETKEYQLLFESNEVLNLYTAFQDLYLISDPFLESTTNIYRYNFDDNTVYEPIEVSYSIYGMADYFAELDSYYIMSVTNLDSQDFKNEIALFDYGFEPIHVLYTEEEPVVHLLFSGYGKTLIGTKEGALYFKDLSYEVIGEDYARWPEILSPEFIRIEQSIFLDNPDTGEIELYSETLFYDEDYYPQGAKFLIQDDSGNFYAIDNEFIGFVHFHPFEIDQVFFPSYLRVIYLVIGIFSYGFFATLGHKRN